jgi:hypothetical protein
MALRHFISALLPILLVVIWPSACHSDSPEASAEQTATVTTCRFGKGRREAISSNGKFEVRGTPDNPQYFVTFHDHSGNARLEQQDGCWPTTFRMKVSGPRDTILFVSLTPEGYAEMSLLFVPDKKWVNYYDAKGKCLDGPAARAFRIETAETADGVDVKVTPPGSALSVRHWDVRYYSTAW